MRAVALVSSGMLVLVGFLSSVDTQASVGVSHTGPTLTKPVRTYIDSDAANEIDDPYAIYRALVASELAVVGLSSIGWKAPPSARQVSFGDATRESQKINEDILRLTGLAKKISHPLGALSPMKDKSTAVDSPAARDIIAKAKAMTAGQKLRVYTLGAMTNVASALLLDPGIADKIAVYIIGYNLQQDRFRTDEFNALGDLHAAEYMLESRAETHIMPANVARDFKFLRSDAQQRLKGAGRTGEYLLDHWDRFLSTIPLALKDQLSAAGIKDGEWIMWDVVLIEASIRPSLAESTVLKSYDAPLHVWTDVDEQAMQADFWSALAAKSPRSAPDSR